uniref:Disease resistance N-terminal domain-containing protein n=1 Tax=Quercus lobata TaxID=97700 RepID=A0A7N2MM37_QUELO
MEGLTRSIGISTSVDAELWTFRDGLMLYINLNLMAVEIEIDAKVILDQNMAESFRFNFAAKVLVKISSPIFQEVVLIWGVEGDLEKLEDTLSTDKAVLLDAEEQQGHNQEQTVWLGKL